MTRLLTVTDTLAAVRDHAAARLLGERCPTCGERTKYPAAHAFIEHAERRPW